MYYKTQLDFDNDIAVMKLSKPVEFKRNVNQVCLPSKSEKLQENAKCYISGKCLKFQRCFSTVQLITN